MRWVLAILATLKLFICDTYNTALQQVGQNQPRLVIALCSIYWAVWYLADVGMLVCKQGFYSALIVVISLMFHRDWAAVMWEKQSSNMMEDHVADTDSVDKGKQLGMFLWVIIIVTILMLWEAPPAPGGLSTHGWSCGRVGDKILNLASSEVQWLLWWVIGGGSYHNVLRGIIVGSK